MAEDDFAILVGIQRYPNIRPLSGPEQDVCDFRRWIEQEGGVPEGNIFQVLTSEFERETEPTMEQVERELGKLRRRVKEYIDEKRQQARRLYIYLAGHGFSWNVKNAALLTANSDYEYDRSYHIAGRAYAEWFRNAAYFREIVLLMDCCRTEYPNTPLRFPWPSEDDPHKTDVSIFYGFATKAGFEAREMAIPESGPVRGKFTYTLLQGLEHADRDADGKITGATLSKYIYNRLPQLPGPRQEPHIEVFPPHAFDWSTRVQSVRSRVQIVITPPQDAEVVLEGPDLNVIGTFRADQPINLQGLTNGAYNLRWTTTGDQQGLDILGAGGLVTIVINRSASPEHRVSYARF